MALTGTVADVLAGTVAIVRHDPRAWVQITWQPPGQGQHLRAVFTLDSWRRTRRVIGKAEHTPDGANPRFIVTSLKRTRVTYDARPLYGDLYCARGEAENCIGEQFEL